MSEGAEGAPGLVGGHLDVAEVEDGPPELEHALDGAEPHVAVLVQGDPFQFSCLPAAAPGDGAEELAFLEVPVLVEVAQPLLPAEAFLFADELVVELFLEPLVPGDEVVGAGDVLGVVLALAAATDGVEDLVLWAFVVGEVVEQELGAEVTVAVVEVFDVDDVGVHDLPRVLGVPAAQDEGVREDLVAELSEVDLAVLVVDFGEEEFLHCRAAHGVRALAHVVAPLLLPLESLEEVDDGGVDLAVVLVQSRHAVVGEDVVDVAVALRHVGLAPVVPALHEEVLNVVVGDVLAGRDEVFLGGVPGEFVAARELPGVPRVFTRLIFA